MDAGLPVEQQAFGKDNAQNPVVITITGFPVYKV
jgi:hypothetical protein